MRVSSATLLACITVAGAALRVAGIGFGLPFQLRIDEEHYQNAVVRIAETGSFEPELFAYPALPWYALDGVLHVAHVAARAVGAGVPESFAEFARDPSIVIPIQRWIACAFGIATIPLVYAVGCAAASTAAGLVGAAFVAFTFMPVRDSHFGVVDAPLAFVATLVLLVALRAGASGRIRDFAVAGALAGIATAMKYLPAVLFASIAVAALEVGRRDRVPWPRRLVGPRLVAAAIALVVAFLVGAPYTLLAFDRFVGGFGAQVALSKWSGPRPLDALGRIAGESLPMAVGVALTALSLVGLFFALARGPWTRRVVAVGALAYAFALAPATFSFHRYVLPMVPALLVLAAVALVDLLRRFPARAFAPAAAIATAALVAAPLARAIAIDRLFLRETTVERAAAYVRERLPAGAVVAVPNEGAEMAFRTLALATWDPPELFRNDEWYALVPRHPIPSVGADPDGWDDVRRRAAVTKLAE
ncbi:MAG TPA: glycosyltransferase family 39 protein, partial [Planctomycetota bacterium]|nr:glycosyltransferase family 39 protein [Planctomycetota bacterium]